MMNVGYPTRPNAAVMQPPGGGGEQAGPEKFLYVKVRIGKDFPGEDGVPVMVEVKKGEFSGKKELKNKDKEEVVVAFPCNAPQRKTTSAAAAPAPAAEAGAIEIAVTDKEKNGGKVKLQDTSGWYGYSDTDAALSPYPFAADVSAGNSKPQRVLAGVWSGDKTHPAFQSAVVATRPAAAANNPAAAAAINNPSLLKKDHAHPKLAYYQLLLVPYVLKDKDPLKMNDTYMHFYLEATVENQRVQTFSYSPLPIVPNDQHQDLSYHTTPFWFVKVKGTPPDSVKLVLKLMARPRNSPEENGKKTAVVKEVGIAEKRLKALSPDKYESVKLMTPGGDEDDRKDTGVLVRVWKSADLTGYHVFDDPLDRSSNFHPTGVTDSGLSGREIGSLAVKIRRAWVAAPAKKGAKGADAYCVVRYDRNWHRTRTATVPNNPAPAFDDECKWKVYEMNTVFTVGLFENCQPPAAKDTGEDQKKEAAAAAAAPEDKNIGRVKIHVSTLDRERTYCSLFHFSVKQPDGSLKEMGGLELEYTFRGGILPPALQYFRPLLPPDHYKNLIPEAEVDRLRPFAAGLVAEKLAEEKPPLKKKVVEYMYGLRDEERRRRRNDDANREYVWRMGNTVLRALENVFSWRNPKETGWVLTFSVFAMAFPELVPSTIFLLLVTIPMNAYFNPPKSKQGANVPIIIILEGAEPDKPPKDKYDELRKKALEYETFSDNLATKAESLKALLSWRNPLATAAIMAFCFVAAVVHFFVSFRFVAIICVLCVFSYPLFLPPSRQGGIPPLNFLRRVPGLNDNDYTVI